VDVEPTESEVQGWGGR